VGHEPGNKVNVTAQAVELGNRDVALKLPSGGQCGLKLGAAIQCVSPLPCLHFNELAGNFEALGLRELREGVALGLNTEPGARHTQVNVAGAKPIHM